MSRTARGTALAALAVTFAVLVAGIGGAIRAANPSTAAATDDFASAGSLSPGSGSVTGSTVGATKQAGEPAHGANSGGHSIWWRWTPSLSGLTTIDTCGSDFDTLVGVYTGATVNALTTVATDDDGRLCGLTSLQSSVYFDAVAGRTYAVAVDGYNGASGSVALRVLTPRTVGHDDFVDAQPVPPAGASLTGSNANGTKEPGEPDHAGNSGGHSIWWTWTPTATETTLIDTCGSDFDTLVGVYTGASVDALTEVASNDDSDACGAGSQQSALSFHADSGTTYAIAVDGFDGASGTVKLHVSNLPGDDFDHARQVPPGGATSSGSTVLATKEAGEPDHAGNSGGHSIWWTWTPIDNATALIDTCGSSFNTLLGVYTGASVDALTEVASNDDSDACGAGSQQSEVTFDALGGTTYAIAVDGFDGATGSVVLHVTGPDVVPPDAPTITSTASGNGWLEVAWDPPAFDGGAAVAGYTVTLSTGETIDVAVPGHAATLPVSNDIPRTAHVTATNSAGTGAPSAESAVITPTDVSVDVTTTYDDDGSARLLKTAAYLGESPEDAQLTSTYVVGFIVGLVGAPVKPVDDAGATGPHSYTTTWADDEQSVLTTVMQRFCLTPDEAQQFSVRLVGYLLAFGGN